MKFAIIVQQQWKITSVMDTKQQIHKHFKWNEDICKFFDKKT